MPSSSLVIREATQSDIPAIASLMSDLGYPTTVETMTERLTPILRNPDHRTFVGHPVNGEVGTWLAPSGSQICSPFACPYSRLQ